MCHSDQFLIPAIYSTSQGLCGSSLRQYLCPLPSISKGYTVRHPSCQRTVPLFFSHAPGMVGITFQRKWKGAATEVQALKTFMKLFIYHLNIIKWSEETYVHFCVWGKKQRLQDNSSKYRQKEMRTLTVSHQVYSACRICDFGQYLKRWWWEGRSRGPAVGQWKMAQLSSSFRT